ncbi:unnamed protein product, partial [marine sediment metagenome]
MHCRGAGAWYVPGDDRRPVAVGAGPWLLSAGDGHVLLDGQPQAGTALELHPEAGLFQLGERTYRGSLAVRANAEGKVAALNLVEPEQYLRSVVGSEMYSRWPLDALMAQAVAARTYMLHTFGSKGYLDGTDLAYKGVGAESRAADLAVELSRGIILTYDGRLFPAYFSSTCGGHTASAEKVFGDEPLGALTGGKCEW